MATLLLRTYTTSRDTIDYCNSCKFPPLRFMDGHQPQRLVSAGKHAEVIDCKVVDVDTVVPHVRNHLLH